MFEAVKSCHISGLIYEEAAPVIFWDLKDSMNKTTKSGKDWSFLKDLATGQIFQFDGDECHDFSNPKLHV